MASFPKHERLTGERRIEKLFDRRGLTFKSFPLMLIVRPLNFEDGTALKVLISVPKKKFKKAVDRNLVRRRIRAVHQSLKSELAIQLKSNETFGVGIIYISSSIEEIGKIESAYKALINQIHEKVG